jgi:FkbM family methyltransferase
MRLVKGWSWLRPATGVRRRAASTRLDDARRLGDLSRRVHSLHRSVIDPGVLQGLLPLRVPAARQRAGGVEAQQREMAFRHLSAAYAAQARADLGSSARSTAIDGLTWWVPVTRPADEAYTQRYVAKQHFPWRAISQTRDVSVGGVMLDIGANIGRMSVPRVALGDVQLAYCAEPEPLNYHCLVRNITDNGFAGLLLPDHAAIGAADGTIRLQRARSSGGHRLATGHDDDAAVDVPCWTLDTWVRRLGIDVQQVTFVKVDVQGAEGFVFAGADRMLSQRHVAWQVEIDPPLLTRQGFSVPDLLLRVQTHFTHFIDLNRRAGGPRVRTTAALAEALAYVTQDPDGRTDIVAFNALGLDV